MVVEGLNAAGIPSKVEANGTVSVPAAQVADARMRLAQSDKLPTPSPAGQGPAGLSSFSTPAQEREAIRAGQEANLARSKA
jgi:flagellar biosynthesis/type III secretory pathway M-ring protein FliF/YscJ